MYVCMWNIFKIFCYFERFIDAICVEHNILQVFAMDFLSNKTEMLNFP